MAQPWPVRTISAPLRSILLAAVLLAWPAAAGAQALGGGLQERPEFSLDGTLLAQGQSKRAISDKLDSIRDDIEEEEARSENEANMAADLLGDIRSLDDKLLGSSRKTERLREEEEQLAAEQEELAATLRSLENDRRRSKDLLVRRLSSLYRRGRLGSNRALVQVASSTEPLRMARYLAAISQADSGALADYEQARSRHVAAIEAMEAKKALLAKKKRELGASMGEYERTKEQKVALLEEVEARLDARTLEMRRLKEVEDALKRILDAAPDTVFSRSRRLSRRQRSRMLSFDQQKGKLEPPVSGAIVTAGSSDGGEGQDEARPQRRGIDIRGYSGSNVVAVAAGELVFSGPFPGLGKTAIINHGDRYHTVYAQLGEVDVEVGEMVDAGDRLGTLSEERPTLHFEVRSEGKATDPLEWIKGGKGAFD